MPARVRSSSHKPTKGLLVSRVLADVNASYRLRYGVQLTNNTGITKANKNAACFPCFMLYPSFLSNGRPT